ncbi:MAG: sigma-70 family RNA polymerase sigma factor [Planctomycetes bacterium]|nr:sigma-70 family RNA polymerase sigma factor [Planctomycetota bacterium]MCH9724781.1 sigma-70 family RNA polymerase sigma factor [Planctomycetota bacterium]MCH9778721.1 sigma-70 family RNA polymerase sigma factor [Planctomycetota bacterium]MCH9792056.1 sigma-70 family RNA polymerase sigma factor [Planctomycetota bacterium]
MQEVTRILNALEAGDVAATDQLLPIVYAELRKLAGNKISQEAPGQTLTATALVHEAYLRLVGNESEQQWDHRGHFFAAAAESMRRILIENARRKKRLKHGGEHDRIELPEIAAPAQQQFDDLLALDAALTQFAKESPEKAELVKLRYFAGLSELEAAEVLGISRATAARHWAYSRAWLFSQIKSDADQTV